MAAADAAVFFSDPLPFFQKIRYNACITFPAVPVIQEEIRCPMFVWP